MASSAATATLGWEAASEYGGWEPLPAAESVKITAALAGSTPWAANTAVKLKSGVEIRFGAAAVSTRHPKPPNSGVLQVFTRSGHSRPVRVAVPARPNPAAGLAALPESTMPMPVRSAFAAAAAAAVAEPMAAVAEPMAAVAEPMAAPGGGATRSSEGQYIHGAITKAEAEALLKSNGGLSKPGKFLVRQRKRGSTDACVLCVVYKGAVTHHKLSRVEPGAEWMLSNHGTAVTTLPEVINQCRSVRPRWPVPLTEGVPSSAAAAAAAPVAEATTALSAAVAEVTATATAVSAAAKKAAAAAEVDHVPVWESPPSVTAGGRKAGAAAARRGVLPQFEHRGPGGKWETYSSVQNAQIAEALAGRSPWDNIPTIKLQGMPFELRFGANAVSKKWRQPPTSGMLQVNVSSDNSRAVRAKGAGSDDGVAAKSG